MANQVKAYMTIYPKPRETGDILEVESAFAGKVLPNVIDNLKSGSYVLGATDGEWLGKIVGVFYDGHFLKHT